MLFFVHSSNILNDLRSWIWQLEKIDVTKHQQHSRTEEGIRCWSQPAQKDKKPFTKRTERGKNQHWTNSNSQWLGTKNDLLNWRPWKQHQVGSPSCHQKPITPFSTNVNSTMQSPWPHKFLPTACGKLFNVDHTLSCPKGGYIHARHNGVRDLIGEVAREISNDVEIEPHL